jgi:hypothetical protein
MWKSILDEVRELVSRGMANTPSKQGVPRDTYRRARWGK